MANKKKKNRKEVRLATSGKISGLRHTRNKLEWRAF